MDIEVFTFNALEQSFLESKDPFEREHVTQYIHRNTDRFKIHNLKYDYDLSYLRWTIDTLSDLQMAREVYNNLYKEHVIFSFNEILEFLSKNPHIEIMNQGEERSAMYTNIKNNY
jgi:spore coat polysaccharide biosynthesis protein SpsF